MSVFLQRVTVAALSGMALLFVSVGEPHAAGSETVNCDSPGRDLQKKLDTAAEGSTVFITGTCDGGPYILRHDVDLNGFGEVATLSAAEGFIVLHVSTSTSTISGITIDADGVGRGIFVGGGQVHLLDVVIENAGEAGLFVDSGGSASIGRSIFRENRFGAIISGSGANLFNSTFEMNEIGIIVQLSANAHITGGSVFDGNDVGITIASNSSAFIADASITNNVFNGINVAKQGLLEMGFIKNTFTGNGGFDLFCGSRGIVEADQPQISDDGLTSIDASCLVFGTLF